MSLTALLADRERAVLAAIGLTKPPYADAALRRSRMISADFNRTVRGLMDRGILVRRIAPRGELLYRVGERQNEWRL